MNQGKDTIVDEWNTVEVPPPPELKEFQVEPQVTALLILDIQNQNCNVERRPRCVASVPKIRKVLTKARAQGMSVIYSLTRTARPGDAMSARTGTHLFHRMRRPKKRAKRQCSAPVRRNRAAWGDNPDIIQLVAEEKGLELTG